MIYNVQYFEQSAMKLAQTNLRNTIGELALDETLNSRERINTQLREVLDDITDKWGVKSPGWKFKESTLRPIS